MKVKNKNLNSFIRLCFITVICFLLGILSIAFNPTSSSYFVYSELYFDSFSANNIMQFAFNALKSCRLNILLIILSLLSTFTFFCPAVVYSITAFSGIVNGSCMALSCFSSTDLGIVFCIYTVVFTVLFVSFQACIILKFNLGFIDTRKQHNNRYFVSPIVISFFKKIVFWMSLFIILHILYCFIMYLI